MNPIGASTSSAVRYSLLPSTRRASFGSAAEAFPEKQHEQTSPSAPTLKLPQHRSRESISRLVAAAATATPSSPRWRRLGFAVLLCASFAAVVALLTGSAGTRDPNGSRLDPLHRIPVDFETREVPSEWRCNPFKEAGRLQVDTKNKVGHKAIAKFLVTGLNEELNPEGIDTAGGQYNNVWRPYDEDCPTSQMFQGLIRAVNKTRERHQASRPARTGPLRSQDTSTRLQVDQDGIVQFPWLVNATVLLIGRSQNLSALT